MGPFQGQARLRMYPARQTRLRHRCFRAVTVDDFPISPAIRASLSELVVPLIEAGEASGVLDLGSPLFPPLDKIDEAVRAAKAARLI